MGKHAPHYRAAPACCPSSTMRVVRTEEVAPARCALSVASTATKRHASSNLPLSMVVAIVTVVAVCPPNTAQACPRSVAYSSASLSQLGALVFRFCRRSTGLVNSAATRYMPTPKATVAKMVRGPEWLRRAKLQMQ